MRNKEKIILPVILAGGSGKRLWPLSRDNYPKQFLKLYNNRTLFQNTVLKVRNTINKEIYISTTSAYKPLVERDLRELRIKAKIIVEPEGKNTAPSIILSYLLLSRDKNNLLFLPSDHHINNYKEVMSHLLSSKNRLPMIFGVKPLHPSIHYGYLQVLKDKEKVKKVKKFIEKPGPSKAKALFKKKNLFWNSGMLYLPKSFEQQLGKYYGEMNLLKKCLSTVEILEDKSYFFDKTLFKRLKKVSFDNAVLTNLDDLECSLLSKTQWSDIGNWEEVYETLKKKNGSYLKGNIKSINSKSNLIISDKKLVITKDINNLALIDSENGLLISSLGGLKDSARYIEKILDSSSRDLNESKTEIRPWGSFHNLVSTKNYKVKKLVIKYGQEISLQRHKFRSEHWVVVEGQGIFTKNKRKRIIKENDYLFIAKRDVHKILNEKKKDLVIIEIQFGDKVIESDIERLQDKYKR